MKSFILFALLASGTNLCGPAASQKIDPPPAANISPTPLAEKSVPVQVKDISVWSGAVSVINVVEGTDPNVVWVNDELNEPELQKTGSFADVDVMNCGGFIASGKMARNERGEMRLKIAPGNYAADAADKIKQCAEREESEEKFITSKAFAVAPGNAQRKVIKTAKVVTKKVFESLPADARESHGKKRIDLSQMTDIWADLDGDGTIDIVEISATSEEESGRGVILLRGTGGTWKRIGSTGPA